MINDHIIFQSFHTQILANQDLVLVDTLNQGFKLQLHCSWYYVAIFDVENCR